MLKKTLQSSDLCLHSLLWSSHVLQSHHSWSDETKVALKQNDSGLQCNIKNNVKCQYNNQLNVCIIRPARSFSSTRWKRSLSVRTTQNFFFHQDDRSDHWADYLIICLSFKVWIEFKIKACVLLLIRCGADHSLSPWKRSRDGRCGEFTLMSAMFVVSILKSQQVNNQLHQSYSFNCLCMCVCVEVG